MGCDIHMITEIRRGGAWQEAAPTIPCADCDSTGKRETGNCYWCRGRGKLSRYNGRNYHVFSVLADVRNGHGEFKMASIAPGRGVPADSLAAKNRENCGCEGDEDGECEHIWLGDHSHTWASLAELLAYDWDKRVPVEGWVSEEQFRSFREKGKPDSYCGGVAGRLVRHIGNSEMSQRLDKPRRPEIEDLFNRTGGGKLSYYTLVRWEQKTGELCGSFYQQFIPALKAYAEAEGVSHDDVRIVFGFDS